MSSWKIRCLTEHIRTCADQFPCRYIYLLAQRTWGRARRVGQSVFIAEPYINYHMGALATTNERWTCSMWVGFMKIKTKCLEWLFYEKYNCGKAWYMYDLVLSVYYLNIYSDFHSFVISTTFFWFHNEKYVVVCLCPWKNIRLYDAYIHVYIYVSHLRQQRTQYTILVFLQLPLHSYNRSYMQNNVSSFLRT